MSATTVTIAADGTPSPSDVRASPGDAVSFRADGADVVLCVAPTSVFGGERYEIAAGGTLDLTVQSGATGAFEFLTHVGDLAVRCRDGSRDKGRGGRGAGGID